MFLFYAVHYPQPDKEALLIEQMQHFGELIQQQPGIIFVNPTPFRDPAAGTLINLAIWESPAAFQASWPALVQHAPPETWEVKPREVHMLTTAA
ncbi:MAG: hypothetical protein M3Q65_20220 [Chloroflexota bacterium]|nr:hypothetical protein [Chloroflexota bacterium]